MDYRTFMDIVEGKLSLERDNHPKELSKKLPKDYSYSKPEREGKHSTSKLQVKEPGKKEPTDTDIKVTGSVIGDKASTSFWKKDKRTHNTLSGIDKQVKSIQGKSDGDKKSVASRMSKAYKSHVASKGKKALSDVTGRGSSKNPPGKGNKALKRATGG